MFLTAANENLTGSKVREEGRACFGLQLTKETFIMQGRCGHNTEVMETR